MSSKINEEYLYYLDSMRAILMMLGVVVHSSQVYNSDQTWFVFSTDSSLFAHLLVESIHAFRMPAFFVVSGFFCYLTLSKYPSIKFIKIRAKRILLPLLSTLITLNVIQFFLLKETGWLTDTWSEFLRSGLFLSHLWFLVNLVVYLMLSVIVFTVLKKQLILLSTNLKKAVGFIGLGGVLLLLPLINVLVLSLNSFGFPLYDSIYAYGSVFKLVRYAPYFLFGVYLAFDRGLLYKICQINITLPIIALLLLNAGLRSVTQSDGFILNVVQQYLWALNSWLMVTICFCFFYKFMNYRIGMLSFLSSSSYTVYLFHNIIVVSMGCIFVSLSVPPSYGLIALIFLTTAFSLLIHQKLISKSKLLQLTFNGR